MDASPDRPYYTGLKFQFPTVRHTEPSIEIIIAQPKPYYFCEIARFIFPRQLRALLAYAWTSNRFFGERSQGFLLYTSV
jgi:hypothetical protein